MGPIKRKKGEMKGTVAARMLEVKRRSRILCLTIRAVIRARWSRVRRAFVENVVRLAVYLTFLVGLVAIALLIHGIMIANQDERIAGLERDKALMMELSKRTEYRLRRLELIIDVNIQGRENLIEWIETSQDLNAKK